MTILDSHYRLQHISNPPTLPCAYALQSLYLLTDHDRYLIGEACGYTLKQHALTLLDSRFSQTLLKTPNIGLNTTTDPTLSQNLYPDMVQEACQVAFALASKPLAFTKETLHPSLSNPDQVLRLTKEVSQTLANLRSIYEASVQQSAKASTQLSWLEVTELAL